MRRKNPKKTTQYTKAKKRILAITGKKRIGPTKAQRRARHAALEMITGHKILKLSDVVSKPSRYRITRRVVEYDVKKERRPGESKLVGHRESRWGGTEPVYEFVPSREVVVSKTPIGEKLIVKRVRKKGSGKGGNPRGQGPVRYGSARAIRQMTKKTKHKKFGTKGKKTGKPKKKKKKKR